MDYFYAVVFCILFVWFLIRRRRPRCPMCGGTGRFRDAPCEQCHGSGRV